MTKLLIVTSITLSGLLVSSHSHVCGVHTAAGDAETSDCCSVPHEHEPQSNSLTPVQQFVDGVALDHDCALCRLLAQFQIDIPAVDRHSLEDLIVSESISVSPVFLKEICFRQSGRAPPMLSGFCS
ncbi:MAG: hypothetical protein GY818_12400 [Planctomycetaceae bacterium]|nr:hypothetical protein [Planctomycetaceae bacterium]